MKNLRKGSLVLFLMLTLTGCGVVNYKNPDAYVDVLKTEIDKANPEYLSTVDEYAKAVGITKVEDAYVKYIKKEVSKDIKDYNYLEAKKYYESFTKGADDYLKQDDTVDEMNKQTKEIKDKLNDKDQIKKDKANVKRASEYISKHKDEVKKYLDKHYN